MTHLLEDNWDFETGDLSCWTAEGDAFKNQPTHGNSITTSRVSPVTLGGDYWDVPYPIGHHYDYWIGTAENPLGDAATGTLTSQEFSISRRYIHFLVSGTDDLNAIRVELQIRAEDYQCAYKYIRDHREWEGYIQSLPEPSRLLRDGVFVVVLRTTGHNSEVMRRETWDVTRLLHANRAANVQLRARIKIVDASEAGHINVDHFQFVDDVPQPDHLPVWGFADLHCHPMIHLAFGGKLFWGTPTDPIQRIRRCDGAGHGGRLLSGRVLHTIEAKNDPQYGPGKHAACCWPTFASRTHQEMHVDWIRRAYEGGLRLMCAYAVNNQLLEHLMRTVPLLSFRPRDDVHVVLDQVEAMKKFVDANAAWMGVAYSSLEARQIILQGKLAVVLGVEVDQLGGWKREDDCTDGQVAALLQMLYAQGIRMLTPIHLADNAFGGCAIYDEMFNTLNYYLHGEYYRVEDGSPFGVRFRLQDQPEKIVFGRLFPRIVREAHPLANYASVPPGHGHRNTRGLTGRGRLLIREMIRRGMVIDVDHMSQKAVDDTLEVAEYYDYPVVSSHTSFQELAREAAPESLKTRIQIERIRNLGGVLAPITSQGDVRDAGELFPALAGRVPNDYAGSSKSWAQAYLYAVKLMRGKGVALGTDFNGLVVKPCPRFAGQVGAPGRGQDKGYNPGPLPYTNAPEGADNPWIEPRGAQRNAVRYAHYDHARERRLRETSYSGSLDRLHVPLTAADGGQYDINFMGLAHYGMLPDFLQDGRNIGLTDKDLAPLFRSAEDYIQMWEKCEYRSRAVVPTRAINEFDKSTLY